MYASVCVVSTVCDVVGTTHGYAITAVTVTVTVTVRTDHMVPHCLDLFLNEMKRFY